MPHTSDPTWKKLLNDTLRRTTGYQLQRARPVPGQRGPAGGAPAAGPKGPRTAHGPGAGAGAELGPKPGPKPGPKQVHVPDHYDEAATATIRRVAPRTMTSPVKLYSFIQSLRYVVAAELPGAVVECGVWRGGSMQAAAWTLQEVGATDRELYLFDTFEGMPPPTEEDRRIKDGSSAGDLLEQHDRSHPVWAYAGLDDVRAGMAETGYPAERVHLVQGMVEDTVPEGAPETIAVLRLDTDWYSSTKHELEHLYHRLVPGGVLILDDYGHWDGARQATDEFLATLDEQLLLVPIASGRIAVKPFSRPGR